MADHLKSRDPSVEVEAPWGSLNTLNCLGMDVGAWVCCCPFALKRQTTCGDGEIPYPLGIVGMELNCCLETKGVNIECYTFCLGDFGQ
jgi:hypothetical protein